MYMHKHICMYMWVCECDTLEARLIIPPTISSHICRRDQHPHPFHLTPTLPHHIRLTPAFTIHPHTCTYHPHTGVTNTLILRMYKADPSLNGTLAIDELEPPVLYVGNAMSGDRRYVHECILYDLS